MSTKPILFNTDMVRGLLANRKTATRRVVKPQPRGHMAHITDGTIHGYFMDGNCQPYRPPYRPGDILYVRETWQEVYETEYDADAPGNCVDVRSLILNFDSIPKVEAGISTNCSCAAMAPRMKYYVFKASDIEYADSENGLVWRPSIHMPREAARIFLRVTDVRVERLQDITYEDCLREGITDDEIDERDAFRPVTSARWLFARLWDRCYAKPRPIKGEDGTIDHYESYPWEDVQETRTYKGKPWYVIGNPWVWVIEFERISRKETMNA